MTTDKSEKRSYLIFVVNNPPQILHSSIDLVQTWLDQLRNRAANGEWWRPITFEDDETGATICAYTPNHLIGIVQGALAPKETGETP